MTPDIARRTLSFKVLVFANKKRKKHYRIKQHKTCWSLIPKISQEITEKLMPEKSKCTCVLEAQKSKVAALEAEIEAWPVEAKP
jgi:hypothetical protein